MKNHNEPNESVNYNVFNNNNNDDDKNDNSKLTLTWSLLGWSSIFVAII